MNPHRSPGSLIACSLTLVLSAAACAEAPATPKPDTTATPAPTATPDAAMTAPPPASSPQPSPSPTPAGVASARPAAPVIVPGPLEADIGVDSPLEEGWATIDQKADESERAWLEGEIQQGDRLIISTSNVRRFRLDLTRLHLDWEKRILLRMDQFNSELTRKRWPEITFERTSSGAWQVVAE